MDNYQKKETEYDTDTVYSIINIQLWFIIIHPIHPLLTPTIETENISLSLPRNRRQTAKPEEVRFFVRVFGNSEL